MIIIYDNITTIEENFLSNNIDFLVEKFKKRFLKFFNSRNIFLKRLQTISNDAEKNGINVDLIKKQAKEAADLFIKNPKINLTQIINNLIRSDGKKKNFF